VLSAVRVDGSKVFWLEVIDFILRVIMIMLER
jgi:hypothetical protein